VWHWRKRAFRKKTTPGLEESFPLQAQRLRVGFSLPLRVQDLKKRKEPTMRAVWTYFEYYYFTN